jgi:hypothetical protein
MKSAATRQLAAPIANSRQCAYCGKDMTRGHGAAGFERLIAWAKEAGIAMKVEDGRYLNPACAGKVRALMAAQQPHRGSCETP